MLSIAVFSCNSSNQKQTHVKLSNFLTSQGVDMDRFNKIIFLNLDACNACNDHYKKFINNNIMIEDVLFILCTDIRKKANAIINYEDYDNIILDYKRRAINDYGLMEPQQAPVMYYGANNGLNKKELNPPSIDQLIFHYGQN
jgi:hypothetical protein